MRFTVTALEPQRRNPELVDLHIDGELRASIAYAVASAERLRTGDVLSEEALERVLAADRKWQAKQAALSLLAVRARARGELIDRLRRKGFPRLAIEHAIAEVERLGLIDDAAFAESWVRDRLRLRPRGTQALIYELGRKHVSAATARAAIERVLAAADTTDADLCMAAAARWASTHPAIEDADEQRARERRLSAFLARRGYPSAAIRDAVRWVRTRADTSAAHEHT